MGVTTATTIQNDTEFENVFWEKEERILEQIKILQKKFDFSIAKIGLVENFEILEKIVAVLHEENKNIKIIWDPILKASAGFSFHEKIEQKKLINLLNSIFLVTPNIEEHKMLFSKINPKKIKANILKKGGHSKSNANDILLSEKREFVIEGKRIHSIEKHGTGCVLSSTIASQLLLGKNLKDACIFGKKYMEKFIQSTEGHLGIHEKN
jgi:hydroxymethylpyrimidine/phosphomethylpyrimidine kinase